MPNETLAVVGLGYVGLPLAREASRAGWRCVGLDLSADTVSALSRGQSHVDDVSEVDVRDMLDKGFLATTDSNCLADVDVIAICVPTPLSTSGGPDLKAVEAAAHSISANLRPGQLVILESTTYPGTTEEILIPILEQSGLTAGRDFSVVFSPERIDPGNVRFGVRNTPKVVGGFTAECTARGVAFYSTFVDTVIVAKGLREAELTKLLENTYRHVNIALVNEMAQFCHELDIDLWDAIRCASTKPFGFQAFYPGPGVGGHCIPIDPNYLSHRVRTHLGQPFRFVELAQEINLGMTSYVARRAQDLLNDLGLPMRGSHVVLLGVTYKPNIVDQRESPAVDVAAALLKLGAVLSFHDPFVSDWVVGGMPVPRVEGVQEALQVADVVVLLQAHDAYDLSALSMARTPVLDTRGVLAGEHVVTL